MRLPTVPTWVLIAIGTMAAASAVLSLYAGRTPGTIISILLLLVVGVGVRGRWSSTGRRGDASGSRAYLKLYIIFALAAGVLLQQVVQHGLSWDELVPLAVLVASPWILYRARRYKGGHP
jgi:hypothetical protein